MKQFFLFAVITFFCSCVAEERDEKTSSATDTTKAVSIDTVSKAVVANTPSPEADFVYGIDISKYQGDEIDFITRKQDTLTFIICKATQGVTIRDPEFSNNWKTITAKGFIRGAYHFYQSQDDPVKQAQFFLSVVDSFSRQGFAPIIDFEEASISNTLSVSQIQNNLLTFLKQIEQRTGRTPIIYTDNNTGNRYLTVAAFANYPLFIADYNNTASPVLPGAWKNKQWHLWQKSESYMLNSTQDDFDVFNGGLQELQVFISSN
jgi:lysozyme